MISLRLEERPQIFVDLLLVDELTSDRIVLNGSDQHFFGKFGLVFIVEFEVDECFLANIDIVLAGNREPYATS